MNDRLRRALELARGGDSARAYDAVLAFRPGCSFSPGKCRKAMVACDVQS